MFPRAILVSASSIAGQIHKMVFHHVVSNDTNRAKLLKYTGVLACHVFCVTICTVIDARPNLEGHGQRHSIAKMR